MKEGPDDAGSRKLRRVLRLIGWNALLLVAVLALIGLAGEAWLRSTVPFRKTHAPQVFVPGVGFLRPPDTEIRWTNELDFWAVSRTNRLGFLDREPPSPERAAESCHITVIGDSYIEAKEVPIADKFQVRLEEMAARALPALDVTTSAFGRGGTGQINQLAYYDAYVRPLRPNLVVLVFLPNDYRDNFPLWQSLYRGLDPEHQMHVSAARAEDGSFRLRPPDPDFRRFLLPLPPESPARSQWKALEGRALRASWLLSWLWAKRVALREEARLRTLRAGWTDLLSRRPAYATLLDEEAALLGNAGMKSADEGIPSFSFLMPSSTDFGLSAQGDGSPFYTEALAFTAFALDEFKKRTERDGAALVILASHHMSEFGGGVLDRLNALAAARGIPVIDQGDYIRRQGAELRDAHWPHDGHWNPTGHQWAAEALLEYLKRNRDVCG